MSNSHGIPREDVFLHFYRNVRTVMNEAKSLAEQLKTDSEAQYAFDAERHGEHHVQQPLNWDHVHPIVTKLEDAIQQELIQALQNDSINDIQIAIHHAKASLPLPGQLGGDFRILAEVVDHLEVAVQGLDELCYQRAIAVFGVWGAYWFSIATSGQFTLDPTDHWPIVQIPPLEVLSRIARPQEDESEQEWANAAVSRNRWIYEQVMAKVKFEKIIKELKSKPTKWRRINSVPGIKAAARTYATQYNLPLPEPRQPGRPSGL